MSGLGGIVLAAGGSVRLGQPKQLVMLNGRPLVARAADLASQLCEAGVVVVTGAHHDQVLDALGSTGVTAVYNPRWREGMGASLRQGAVTTSPAVDAVLVLLTDQPFVDAADLRRLVAAWRGAPDRIAAAQYADTSGVPAVFPRRFLDKLRSLSQDQGARKIIDAEAEITAVAIPNAEFDLDTPEALLEMKRKAADRSS